MTSRTARLRRGWSTGKKIWGSSSQASAGITLHYPREDWYEENAAEMLRLLHETQALLTEGLGIQPPDEVTCLVTDPEWASDVFGVAGLALEDFILVACPPRCLSEFAGVAAHELAHLLSRSLGAYEAPFKCEGFACYAAEIIDADVKPFGLPLHYHLVWMLSVGLRPTLPELWRRTDHSPELYDLAWSFATFVTETYGLNRYSQLYGTTEQPLDVRVQESLGMSPAKLELAWFDAARASVDESPAALSRMRRGAGSACSRAAWLSRH
jgi:hypothetical protein